MYKGMQLERKKIKEFPNLHFYNVDWKGTYFRVYNRIRDHCFHAKPYNNFLTPA